MFARFLGKPKNYSPLGFAQLRYANFSECFRNRGPISLFLSLVKSPPITPSITKALQTSTTLLTIIIVKTFVIATPSNPLSPKQIKRVSLAQLQFNSFGSPSSTTPRAPFGRPPHPHYNSIQEVILSSFLNYKSIDSL